MNQESVWIEIYMPGDHNPFIAPLVVLGMVVVVVMIKKFTDWKLK